APQHQQKQQVPDDLFPAWYAPKPVISLGADAVEDDDRFSRAAMTGFQNGIGQQNVPASPTNTMPMTEMTGMTGNPATREARDLSASHTTVPVLEACPAGGASAGSEQCPECICTNLMALGAYRKCPLCGWKGKASDGRGP